MLSRDLWAREARRRFILPRCFTQTVRIKSLTAMPAIKKEEMI
jgi:hypothetical protein